MMLIFIFYIKTGNTRPFNYLSVVLAIGVFLCIILDYILYLITGRDIIFKRDGMFDEEENEVIMAEADRENRLNHGLVDK